MARSFRVVWQTLTPWQSRRHAARGLTLSGSTGVSDMAIPVKEIELALDLAKRLLDIVPLPVATSLLTEESRQRENLLADEAERKKFGDR